jgi:hypothetical protein
MLRREAIVYANVSGSFLPAFVGFADDGGRAVLALEYLTDVRWPPPFPSDVSPLFAALEQASSTTPPPELPAHRRWESRWKRIADDPEPFLGLGACSPDWFERSLERLIAAETQADFEGNELVHNDVYSGNVCFRGDCAILIDWGRSTRLPVDRCRVRTSERARRGRRPTPARFPGRVLLRRSSQRASRGRGAGAGTRLGLAGIDAPGGYEGGPRPRSSLGRREARAATRAMTRTRVLSQFGECGVRAAKGR